VSYYKFTPLLLALLLTSCDSDESDPYDDCGDFGGYNPLYNISGLTLENGKGEHRDEYIGMRKIYVEKITEGESVKADTYVLSLISIKEQLANLRRKSKIRSFSFINSAIACSPVPPYTNQKIVSINISSTSVYSDDTQAGSSLNHIFDVAFDEAGNTNYEKVSDIYTLYSLEEYLKQPDIRAGEVIQLMFNTLPNSGSEHVFTVEYSLDTGEIFEVSSNPVLFE